MRVVDRSIPPVENEEALDRLGPQPAESVVFLNPDVSLGAWPRIKLCDLGCDPSLGGVVHHPAANDELLRQD